MSTTKATFDLSALDTKTAAEKGLVVELEHPLDPSVPFVDDTGVPYSWTILGADAGKVRDKAAKQFDRYFELLRKNKNPGGYAAGEKDNIDRLAAATITYHLPTIDGQPAPEPNEHNARKILSDPRFPWIAEQLTKAIGDRARFFAKNSTS